MINGKAQNTKLTGKGAAAWLLAGFTALLPAAGAADRLIPVEPTAEQLAQPSEKMTSDFYHLTALLKSSDKAGRQKIATSGHAERFDPVVVLKGANLDQIEAYISLLKWSEGTLAELRGLGVEFQGQDPERLLVQGLIPLDKLDAVAALPGVRYLERPNYGIPSGVGLDFPAHPGTVQTEGDANLGTNLIRTHPVRPADGNGIRVGVISAGLYQTADQAEERVQDEDNGANGDPRVEAGNLPPKPGAVVTSGYVGNVQIFPASYALHVVNPLAGQAVQLQDGAEGGAILETIYDIAPKATYYYADGRTDVLLETARNFLKAQGASVIVDNMIFVAAGRYDGTSTISRRAQSMALNDNILYIVSAGNYTPPPDVSGTSSLFARSNRFPMFVNGFFSPDSSQGARKFHNFASGRSTTTRDEYLLIEPQGGQISDGAGGSQTANVIDVSLVWDDRWSDTSPKALDDLDLLLYSTSNGVTIGDLVASSTDLQSARNPRERITAVVNGGTYALAIRRKDGTNNAPRLFTLTIHQGLVPASDVPYLTHGVPLNNADALPPVISVGAVDAKQGVSEVASYTVPGLSPGPGRALTKSFVKWFENQTTPSVVSYANTQAQSMSPDFGSSGAFEGSSAGAAHIGGLAVLLRHTFPTVPSFEYYDLMRDTTPPPGESFANATQLNASTLSQYNRAPVYLRTNGFDMWENIRLYGADNTRKALAVPTTGETSEWEKAGPLADFNLPEYTESDQGLAMSPAGKSRVFGFWQTPKFEFANGDGTKTTALRTDRIYELTARVGSDEADPTKVPNFRLRIMNWGSNEAVLMEVAGLNAEVANTPTTIGGKEYKLYYRPSNEKVAAEGLRFAFDIVHFDENDNPNATLYLQDVSLQELQLPKP